MTLKPATPGEKNLWLKLFQSTRFEAAQVNQT